MSDLGECMEFWFSRSGNIDLGGVLVSGQGFFCFDGNLRFRGQDFLILMEI